MNYTLFTGVLLLAAILFTGIVTADELPGIPPLPAQYYGTAVIDGKPAPVGTIITARIGDETIGTITTTEPGAFGSEGTFGAKLLAAPASSDAEGKEVSFLLGSNVAAETVRFASGDAQKLSLTCGDSGSISVLKNTVEDTTWSAVTTAEVIYSIPPLYSGTITAPEIAHGGKTLLLMETVNASKRTVSGYTDVPVSVSADGTVTFTDDVSDAAEIIITFLGRKLGDVNGDNRVNSLDAAYIAQFAAKLRSLTPVQTFYADANDDSRVNSLDAAYVAQFAAKLRNADYKNP